MNNKNRFNMKQYNFLSTLNKSLSFFINYRLYKLRLIILIGFIVSNDEWLRMGTILGQKLFIK